MKKGMTGLSGRNTPGFTMIEVIVTMMLFAALMAGATLGYRAQIAAVNMQIAADRLAQDIREFEQRALAESSEEKKQGYSYFVQFYQGSGTYIIFRSAPSMRTTVASRQLPNDIVVDGTNFTRNQMGLSIYGTVAVGGTITLKNRVTGRHRYVIVASQTGRVRVSDQLPASWEIN